MLLKKSSHDTKKSSIGSSKSQMVQQSEEIRQSLDVLDRVLSEFDDIETDTNEDSVVPEITEILDDAENTLEENKEEDGLDKKPPPIDRSLKPRSPNELPATPPDLPRKTRLPRPRSGSSSPSSHEYQEINSDMGLSRRSKENLAESRTPPTSTEFRSSRRNSSADRQRGKRGEKEGHRQGRKQKIKDNRSRWDAMSSSSGDLRSPHLKDVSSNPRAFIDNNRADPCRVPHQGQSRRRRSRSSDRWLDHQQHPSSLNEQQMMHDQIIDPRLIDDPSMIDPRLIDLRLIDPRMIDPCLIEEPFPFPQDPIRFPHLMSYNPLPHPESLTPESMSPGVMSPMPPGSMMGPPYLPMEYPPYPMFQYEMGYIPEMMLGGPDVAFLPSRHPAFPGEIPPQYMPPLDFLPGDYPLNYPLDYVPITRAPGMMGGAWVGPDIHPREKWPPPKAEQSQKLVRNHSSRNNDDDNVRIENGKNQLQPGRQQRHHMSGRRFSTEQSDRSDPSSPSEERLAINTRKQSSGYHGGTHSYLESNGDVTSTSSDFRVGEAVRKTSPRVLMKNSTSLPNFSSGKDSGFDEAPAVGDDGSNTVSRGSRAGGGGAFIVSGVFNDSSRMFIPAPPSPTPDYDDDEAGDSDGNESDILQSSQFYVVSDPQHNNNNNYPVKKTLANRNSLSDDSLQNAPVILTKTEKLSKKSHNPLQNMMKEFHQGLPPLDHENTFSDDSLEESSTSPSGPSSISQRKHLRNSLESLISMESSTASFDYMNEGQARNASYGCSPFRSAPVVLKLANNKMHSNSNAKDRKDLNGKIKKSLSQSSKSGFSKNANSELRNNRAHSDSSSRKGATGSYDKSGQNTSENVGKFETIRTMLKEGLIEGLDENPPEFKPPPPSQKSSNERADSGVSSIFSTTKSLESSGNRKISDIPDAPALTRNSHDDRNARSDDRESSRRNETLRSQSSITHERNRDDGDEVEVRIDDTIEIPSSPSKSESVDWTPRPNPHRENARMSLRETPNSIPLPQRDVQSRPSLRSAPSTPSSSKNTSWLHGSTTENDEMLEVSSMYSHCSTGAKVTHVDDLYGQHEQFGSGSEVSSAINGSLASHYSIQDSDNPLTDREFLENMKNMELRPRPDNALVHSEEQGSIGSKESRSGRLFSRVADSIRSGSRTPTPNSSLSTNTRMSNSNLTSNSKSSSRVHGDIIREPWKASLSDSALPTLEYGQLPSYTPAVIPPILLDGSGRFTSNENLAEAISAPYQREFITLSGKREKHSTLPTSLTSSDAKKEGKELRRATSLMVGKKGKETGEGSKFRFNFFRGFWRRKQYSFDNKM